MFYFMYTYLSSNGALTKGVNEDLRKYLPTLSQISVRQNTYCKAIPIYLYEFLKAIHTMMVSPYVPHTSLVPSKKKRRVDGHSSRCFLVHQNALFVQSRTCVLVAQAIR